MSFCSSFEKQAGVEEMSDIELTLKANKHLDKTVKHEKTPRNAAILGALAGATGSAVAKKSLAAGAGITAASAAASGLTGKALKSYHQNKLRAETSELGRRGIYAVPHGDKIYWFKRKTQKRSEN